MHVQQRRGTPAIRQGRGRQVHRRPVLRPARRDAALQRARRDGRRVVLRGRPDVRRVVDPRLPGHPRVRHEADPGPQDGLRRPVPGREDAGINFSIRDPFTDETYSRDPRNIAAKAEAYLNTTGIADTAYFGPEAEFYIFDDVRFETKQNAGYYFIDSIEGAWNTGRDEEGGNLGYKTRYKGGYFPVPPVDHFADLRDEMVMGLQDAGL